MSFYHAYFFVHLFHISIHILTDTDPRRRLVPEDNYAPIHLFHGPNLPSRPIKSKTRAALFSRPGKVIFSARPPPLETGLWSGQAILAQANFPERGGGIIFWLRGIVMQSASGVRRVEGSVTKKHSVTEQRRLGEGGGKHREGTIASVPQSKSGVELPLRFNGCVFFQSPTTPRPQRSREKVMCDSFEYCWGTYI